MVVRDVVRRENSWQQIYSVWSCVCVDWYKLSITSISNQTMDLKYTKKKKKNDF